MSPIALAMTLLLAAPALAQQPAADPKPAEQPAQQPAEKPSDAQPADAQSGDKAAAPELDPRAAKRPMTWSLTFPAELGLDAGIQDQPGDVNISRVGAELGVVVPIGMRSELTLGFDYEYSRYEFSETNGSIAGSSSPFRDINREMFRARFGTQESRQWSWLVGGSVGFSGENGADFGDSVVGSLYGGFGYNVSEHLKIGAALVVYRQLERSPLIIPLPTVDWQIDEQWRLTNAGKPGLYLFFTPEPQWTFSAGARYDSRSFRLDQNGPFPNGVGRESSVPFEADITFRPSRTITVTGGVGVRLFENFEVDNASGDELANFDVNASAYLKLELEWKF